ncbi:NUDIX hydrolase [Candidatus Nomurabacteria bacterium]|nr:NUDIX hydrolase [Candidatus Nomurabacteria bacterium]
MSNKIQQISVKAVFQKDNKVLLVKDLKNVWELPGGRIEHGENPEETLKREIEEELGWKNIQIEKILDSWSFTSQVQNSQYHFVILTYLCSTQEDEVKENEEYTEYKWTPLSEMDSLEMKDGYKKTIKEFLS